MVRVRIGPTETSVTSNSNSYERLTPYDNISDFSSAIYIYPAYNSTNSYKDFPVGSYGYGSTYYIYIQCGWWEYYIPQLGSAYWTKHFSNVICANGTCCCLKWVWNQITNHASGYFVMTATNFGFKLGNYNVTPKSGSTQIIDAQSPPSGIK